MPRRIIVFVRPEPVQGAIPEIGRLAELNQQRRAEGADPIGVGVGVNSGKAVAGNMGSSNRLNYTVLAEEVNLASRLCSIGPGQSGRTIWCNRSGSSWNVTCPMPRRPIRARISSRTRW